MKPPVRILIPVLLIAAFSVWWFRRDGVADGAIVASGTVEATEAQLAFQAAGRIARVSVREGDAVRAGQVLAQLDTTELAAQRRLAEAGVEAARARLRALERGSRSAEIRQAEAVAQAAEEQHTEAVRERARAERLHEGGAVSAQALERARTAERVGAAGLEQARERLALVREGPRSEDIDAARATLAQAEATLARADAVLAHATIEAPFDGVVSVRYREPGESATPGLPVVALRDPGDRWVRIYVPEDRVGTVRVGQPAEIRTDSWPDRVFEGQVEFIASEAEFTPRTVQTTEERSNLVYAVKVRVLGDGEDALKAGLPADVTLERAAADTP
ncbi:MAG: efflux RND transporter periplasmic adaptor subunit [Gemmatimonadota bacterium]|nr:efflux RND transporter periplasmic adaptor subunit [Gemmatimonadota bacterium]